MSADTAYIKAVSLMQGQYAKLAAHDAETKASLAIALKKIKDLETRANAQDAGAKTTLIAFATGDTARGVDDLTAKAKTKAQISATAAKAAAEDYKAAGALAFPTDTNRAIAAYEAAIALAPDDGETLHQLAFLYGERLGRYQDYLRYADKQIAMTSPSVKSRGYLDRGNALTHLADYAGAEAAHRTALDIAIANKLKLREGQALGNLGIIAYFRADYAAAEDYYKRDIAVAKDLGDVRGQYIDLGNLGLVAQKRGNLNAADDYFNRALAAATAAGDVQSQADNIFSLAWTAGARGDLTGQCNLYRRALALYKSINAEHSKNGAILSGNIGKLCS
jgi:tetratricopeptide (TPR) repeat protein